MRPKFTLSETMNRFSTEEACKEFLQERRWPNGMKCPRCNNDKVYALKARPFHRICKAKICGGRNGHRFSALTKTIFENTKLSAQVWFQVIYLMLHSKDGNSALQILSGLQNDRSGWPWTMSQFVRETVEQDVRWLRPMGTTAKSALALPIRIRS